MPEDKMSNESQVLPLPREMTQGELGHVPFLADHPVLAEVRLFKARLLTPAAQNDLLYRPVDTSDPEIKDLADSIRTRGIIEPLVITCDFVIVSGNRRYAAGRLAGLSAFPCRQIDLDSRDPDFLDTLREFNRQREKTDAERLREEVISADPEEAFRVLTEHRRKSAQVSADFIEIDGQKTRPAISKAKLPFLSTCIRIINEREDFWPLSDRQIHYALLNNPPLTHASKPGSSYRNHPDCYKQLTELLTRARLEGSIPMSVIADSTRPVQVWQVHQTCRVFARDQLDGFLKGYYRDLQQSQPNHIEIVGEKNTVQSIIEPVASEYCIPMTTGRGYCSLPPRYEMAQRFLKSGKENVILLVLSDLDPDGEEICYSFARSMRDDFGIRGVSALKVGLTREQVERFRLPRGLEEAKPGSATYAKFVSKYGKEVYELEALPPATLQALLREAIDSVLDIDIYNAQIEKEKQDAQFLDIQRRRVHQAMGSVLASEQSGASEQ